MWEGDPVRVDPKRPLLGFALVAVLCAVLMSLSVSRGWGFDLFKPGKPIASSMGGHGERVPAPAPDAAELVEVGFPVELSTQPLAAQPPVPAKKAVAKSSRPAKPSTAAPTADQQGVVESTTPDTSGRSADRAAARAARQAERSAARAERKLARLEAKTQRQADRLAAQLQRQVEKSAAQARRHAEHAALDLMKAALQG